MADIVFVDTETLGLDIDAPIWEFAGIRRSPDGGEERLHLFIDHDPEPWLSDLPEPFRGDYLRRFSAAAGEIVPAGAAVDQISQFVFGAHIVGAVPNFDTERLAALMRRQGQAKVPWHYHLIDIENLVVGFLAAFGEFVPLPWESDDLSRAIGVDPDGFNRHTAMGDVLWTIAQYDVVMSPKYHHVGGAQLGDLLYPIGVDE